MKQIRRVNRAKDKEAAIKALIKDEEKERPYAFQWMWQLMIFSAMLGYRHNRREALGKFESGKGIDAAVLMKDPCFEGILNLFSLMDNENERLLTTNKENNERKISLFEEFANGGLAILKEKLETADYRLESVITLIAEELHKGPRVDEDLGSIRI